MDDAGDVDDVDDEVVVLDDASDDVFWMGCNPSARAFANAVRNSLFSKNDFVLIPYLSNSNFISRPVIPSIDGKF